MDEKTRKAEGIVDKVFIEASKIGEKKITDRSEMGIAAVLTGMTGFFVAGFLNDYDLAQELTPVFQKRIMPSVNKSEYENYSYILNDSYIKFREAGIEHQFKTEDWFSRMMDEFEKMLLEMIAAETSNSSKDIAHKAVYELYELVKKSKFMDFAIVDRDNVRVKPKILRSIFQVGVFIGAYEICSWIIGIVLSYIFGVLLKIPVLSWLASGIGETIFYTFTPRL